MKTLAMLTVGIWLSGAALPAQTLPEELSGTWSSSTVKFVISNTADGWKVQAWDECRPEWCKWGEVPLSLIATSNRSKTYTQAFASWRAFEEAFTKYVIFKFTPWGLEAEVYTVYHPNVGRSDFVYETPLTRSK